MTKKTRNSNIEIYRILCMFLIVIHHACFHGLDYNNLSFSNAKIISSTLGIFGKVGVIGFVIISGYYMINQNFNVKKIIKVIGEVLFYSVSIFIILRIFNLVNIDIKDICLVFFPITYSSYWFITDYILLLLLSPFLNRFIKVIDKKYLKSIILLLFFLWCFPGGMIKAKLGYTSLNYFLLLYLIAAYIRLYVNINEINYKLVKIILFISLLVLVSSNIIFIYIGYLCNMNFLVIHSAYFGSLNSFIPLFIAICLFLYFINKKEKNYLIINTISQTTLGIYLIHDNFLFRNILWNNIINIDQFVSSEYLSIIIIGISLLVFCICSIIDLFRIKTIEKLYIKMVNFIFDKKKIVDMINNKIKRILLF